MRTLVLLPAFFLGCALPAYSVDDSGGGARGTGASGGQGASGGTTGGAATGGAQTGGAGTGGAGAVGTGGIGGEVCPGYTTPYPCEVMADGPLSYWRMSDETTASTPRDEVTDGPLGLRLGELELVPGALVGDPDGATNFDGGIIDIDTLHEFPGNADYSVELWVKPDGQVYSGPPTLIGNVLGSCAGFEGWTLHFSSSYELGWVRFVCDGPVASAEAPNALPQDSFTYVVGTYDGANLRLFVGGVQVGTAIHQDPITPNHGGGLVMGLEGGSWGLFTGVLDEVAIYDYVLPDERIARHYEVGSGMSLP